MSIVYLNGEFLPLSEARISVLDRGFLFADGVYEVMPAYNGRIFRLQEHLQRLENSLGGIYMKNPLTMDAWKSMLENLVKQNQGQHQSLYLQVTRGVSERDHLFPADTAPTIFAMSKPLAGKSSSTGIAAITCEDNRWKHCNLKTIALLPGVLLRNQAKGRGATEAILYRDNFVTEGAASNVFVVCNGIVKTPAKDERILPGVTRDLVLELLDKEGLDCREESIMTDELKTADEIWITSSTWEIVPVVKLDDAVVGTGQPGPVYDRANRVYQAFKESF